MCLAMGLCEFSRRPIFFVASPYRRKRTRCNALSWPVFYRALMKIALAQLNPTVGDFAGNSARILDFAHRAAQRGAMRKIQNPGGIRSEEHTSELQSHH